MVVNFILFLFQRFFTNVFNGCYAILMFIVVIFFLIYGVEVYFKVFLSFTDPIALPGFVGVVKLSCFCVLESSLFSPPTGSWWLFA